ncbi:hypothetical protein HYH03_001670 [Edaphochlamys debaryana]|uniref:Scaffold protein Nfu/NifU N-terminal domain-containing protein n=1 Tax=Edaphochlamys debaryana TaxID=47281 RepID=A0A835YE48_9CHLO|nr:hypothetical protein HYH03_001670 [Edaphochlamys debaryana]|eukprot:KAG2500911.1 hypothetical protein HYH03_001670 [Edaphochlamys debaryana]
MTRSASRLMRSAGLLGALQRGAGASACAETAAAAMVPQLAASLHFAAAPARDAGVASTSGLGGLAPSSRGWQPWQAAAGTSRGMFIQTQPTPNPNSLMFVPGKQVMESGTLEFSSAREGMKSPLAKRLFAIDGVTAVFFGSDFITVSKRDEYSWPVLKPDVFAAVMEHFASGEPLISDASALAASDTAIHPDDSEVVAMIKELLETRIRPAVQEDGGDIVFRGFEEDTGTVLVKLVGACSTCPSSTVTLKSGIENMLMHYIPEVKNVMEAPPDETDELGLQEFAAFEKRIGAADESEGAEEGVGGSGTGAAAKPQEPKEAHPMAAHLSN